eukprot:11710519-Alexandrium_andersonii.AAC.1
MTREPRPDGGLQVRRQVLGRGSRRAAATAARAARWGLVRSIQATEDPPQSKRARAPRKSAGQGASKATSQGASSESESSPG